MIPTDTVYGLVGSALHPETVERMYVVRKRDLDKPLIILIASIDDVALFGVRPSSKQMEYLTRWWPGKVSVILPASQETFHYLQRNTRTLAFRCPDDEALRNLLKQAGPIVAPSANVQGFPASTTIEEARAYFGERVDFYVDGSMMCSEPSTLVRFENDQPVIVRQGVVTI